MDYDSAGGFVQFGAKGSGSIGLKLRTILAGVATTVLTFTSAGAATFSSSVTTQALVATTLTTSGTAQIGTRIGIGAAPDTNAQIYTTGSVSGAYIAQFLNTNTVAGTSYGVQIKAGTNASDTVLNVMNAAASTVLFNVTGGGAGTFAGGVTASGTSSFGGTVTALNYFRLTPSLTTTAGAARLFVLDPVLNATANGDDLRLISAATPTVARGTFTGLQYIGAYIGTPALTGTGTIATGYQLYIDTPASASTSYAIFVNGGLSAFQTLTTTGTVTLNTGGGGFVLVAQAGVPPTTGAASGDIILYNNRHLRGANAANSSALLLIGATVDDGIQIGASAFVRIAGNAKLRLGDMDATNSSTLNVLLSNATAPTGNPTGGYFLWAETGALKGRGTSGTITTIGAADPHCPHCGRDFMHEWENDGYTEGYLAVCLWCLTKDLGNKPYTVRSKGGAHGARTVRAPSFSNSIALRLSRLEATLTLPPLPS